MKKLLLIGLLGLVAGLTAQDISSKSDPDKALLRELLPKLGKPDTRNQAITDLLEKGTTASVIQIAVNNIVSNSTGISDETKIQAFCQSHKHASVLSSVSYSKLRSFVTSHHDPELNRLARFEEFFEQLFALKYPHESLQLPRESAALAGSTRPKSINLLFCNLLISLIRNSITKPSEQRNREKQAEVITEVFSMFNIMAETMDATEKQAIARHIKQMPPYFYARPEQQFLNLAPIYQALARRYDISEQRTATLEESIAHLFSANTEQNKNTLQFAIRCSLDASVTAKTKILVFEKAQLNADVLLSPAYEELRSYIEFNCDDHFLSHYAFYERSFKELFAVLFPQQRIDAQNLAKNTAPSAQASRRNNILVLLHHAIEETKQMAPPEGYAAIVTVLIQAQQLASSMRDEELLLWRLHVNKMNARYQDDAAYGTPSVGEAYAALFTLLASAKPVGQEYEGVNDAEKEFYTSIKMLLDEGSRDQGIRSILHSDEEVNFRLLIESSVLSGVSAETRRELLQKVEAQKIIIESRELQKLRDSVKQEKAQAEHAAIPAQTPAQEKPVAPEENVQKQKSIKKNKLPAAKKRKNQRDAVAAEVPTTPHDKPVFAQELEEQLMASSTHEQTEHQSAPQETNFIDSFSGLIQQLRQVHLATKNNPEAVSEITQSNNAMQRFLQSYMEQPNVFMHMDAVAQHIQALPARDRAYLELSFANYATALLFTEDLSATIDIADIARQDDPRLWHYVTYLAARLGCISAQTSLAQFHTTRAQESPLVVVANEYRFAQQWLDIAASSTERSDHPRKASVVSREIEPVREQLRGVVDTRIMPLALHTLWQQQAMMHHLNPA